jgi:hypothetical protein
VFKDAKLSTVVFTATKTTASNEANAGLMVCVYPWNSFNDAPRKCSLRMKDVALLDPVNLPIPLVDEDQWRTCLKIHKAKHVRHLGKVQIYKTNRGEINQTIYRDYITEDGKMARLLKGVEISRFGLRDRLKQGYREWIDEKKFLAENGPKPIVYSCRIAIQRITGVDEKLRIVASLVKPKMYFADSTNSIVKTDDSPYRLEYLLGLLNSQLFQWRFKLTSTNNNVGTNEIAAMPFPTIDFSNPADKSRHDKMVSLVDRMLDLHKKLPEAKTPHDKESLQRQISATDREIDRLVYDLYGLTEEEIKIVEDSL